MLESLLTSLLHTRLSGNPGGSTFEIPPESNHFSPPPPLLPGSSHCLDYCESPSALFPSFPAAFYSQHGKHKDPLKIKSDHVISNSNHSFQSKSKLLQALLLLRAVAGYVLGLESSFPGFACSFPHLYHVFVQTSPSNQAKLVSLILKVQLPTRYF